MKISGSLTNLEFTEYGKKFFSEPRKQTVQVIFDESLIGKHVLATLKEVSNPEDHLSIEPVKTNREQVFFDGIYDGREIKSETEFRYVQLCLTTKPSPQNPISDPK